MNLYEVHVSSHKAGVLAQCNTRAEAIAIVTQLTGCNNVEKVIQLV